MKKSDLRQIIREEIKAISTEDYFKKAYTKLAEAYKGTVEYIARYHAAIKDKLSKTDSIDNLVKTAIAEINLIISKAIENPQFDQHNRNVIIPGWLDTWGQGIDRVGRTVSDLLGRYSNYLTAKKEYEQDKERYKDDPESLRWSSGQFKRAESEILDYIKDAQTKINGVKNAQKQAA